MSYSTDHHSICKRCSYIQCASKLLIVVPIFQSVSEWQCDKKKILQKRQFCDFNWLTWQRPLR